MESPAEIRARWGYLRDLLIEQLSRFEEGVLKIHAHDIDVSPDAVKRLKKSILEFDELIARSEARERGAGHRPQK
jgi:hypothetical protein